MRRRDVEVFVVIEAYVNVRSAYGKHWFVGVIRGMLRNGERPAPAEIYRPGDHDVSLIVLQPGGVQRLPVRGIDDYLGIELSGCEREEGREGSQEIPLSLLVESTIAGAATGPAAGDGAI